MYFPILKGPNSLRNALGCFGYTVKSWNGTPIHASLIDSIRGQQSVPDPASTSLSKVWVDQTKGECGLQISKRIHIRIWQSIHELLSPHNFVWNNPEKKWTAPSTITGETAALEAQKLLEKLHTEEQKHPSSEKTEEEENQNWADVEETNSIDCHPQGKKLLIRELCKQFPTKGGETSLESKERIQALLSSLTESIDNLLPNHINKKRFISVVEEALGEIPNLFELKEASCRRAILIAALLGLEPNSALQHCYLIPIRGELRFVLSYKGLIELAMRTRNILFFSAKCVYKEDRFDVKPGLDGIISHTPHENVDERGNLSHVYAICILHGGEQKNLVMSYDQIKNDKRISKRMENPKSPWFSWKEEMCLKTTIKLLLRNIEINNQLLELTGSN